MRYVDLLLGSSQST